MNVRHLPPKYVEGIRHPRTCHKWKWFQCFSVDHSSSSVRLCNAESSRHFYTRVVRFLNPGKTRAVRPCNNNKQILSAFISWSWLEVGWMELVEPLFFLACSCVLMRFTTRSTFANVDVEVVIIIGRVVVTCGASQRRQVEAVALRFVLDATVVTLTLVKNTSWSGSPLELEITFGAVQQLWWGVSQT